MAELLLSETYKGSFPHPDVLKSLDGCVTDGAERAFRLTEREQEHRHRLDEKLVDAQVNLVNAQVRKSDSDNHDRRILVIVASVIAVGTIAAAFLAIVKGYPGGAAIISGGGALATVATLLRVGRIAPGGGDKNKPSRDK
jgi:uncharacterized membrane protein